MKILLHLIPYSLFCCFWPPSLAKYSGDSFLLAWPHVLASLQPLLAFASWRTAFFAPSSQGTAPPGPNTCGLCLEKSCYLYQLIPFSVAPSVCLPPWPLLALRHCFPWSHQVTQHSLLARGWVLTQSFPLILHCATESSGKIHCNNHSGFIITYQHQKGFESSYQCQAFVADLQQCYAVS